MKQAIGDKLWKQFGNRLIFAVAVESIECWLLPLHDEKKADKTKSCLAAVNKALRKANMKGLASSEKAKFDDAYEQASKAFLKRKRLLECVGKQVSLDLFLKQLESIVPPIPPESQSDAE